MSHNRPDSLFMPLESHSGLACSVFTSQLCSSSPSSGQLRLDVSGPGRLGLGEIVRFLALVSTVAATEGLALRLTHLAHGREALRCLRLSETAGAWGDAALGSPATWTGVDTGRGLGGEASGLRLLELAEGCGSWRTSVWALERLLCGKRQGLHCGDIGFGWPYCGKNVAGVWGYADCD